jgi:VWFA-related protein
LKRLGRTVLMGVSIGALLLACVGHGDGAEAAGRTTVMRQQAPAVPPTLRVYSRETVVDVIVTDKDGKPVHGLTQADFTVKENGKEQAIKSFEEFNAETVKAGLTQPQPPELGEEVHSSYPPTPVSGPVNILLIDALNAPPGMVMRVQRETAKYLKTMPEGTQVAVFWLSPGGLRMLQGFTPDRKLLIGAVTRGGAFNRTVENWTRMWLTVDAMDEIAVYVSEIKGRKNLIWFTPGMPVMLLRDGGYGFHEGEMTLVHRQMDAYELLTQAQVAICPIDPRGVGPPMNMTTLLAEEVAAESGGTAYYNTNDLAAVVGKAIATGSEYYTLSYIPPGNKDDGRYHHIWVGVDRPGIQLVYRKGYDSEDPLAAHPIAPGPGLKQAVAAGHAMAVETSSEMQFDVKVQPTAAENAATGEASANTGRRLLPKGGKPGVQYGFLFSVPASQITFTQGADGMWLGSLNFDVAAYGANGVLTNTISEKVRLPLSAEKYAEFIKTPFHFFQKLELPIGQTIVRVGILDDASKKVGTMDIPLTVVKETRPAEAR